MPDIADAAAQARLLAKRGADAAAVVLGAGLHPVRTVREGAHLVQGLVGQRDAETVSPPSSPATPATPKAPTGPKASKAPSGSPAPGPKTVAKPPAPPEPDPVPAEAADIPVQPTGPMPHMSPELAEEVERDYGDEVPGIKEWEG